MNPRRRTLLGLAAVLMILVGALLIGFSPRLAAWVRPPTPSPTATSTPTVRPTPTDTPSVTSTQTHTPSLTPTPSATLTAVPSATPTATVTASPTATNLPASGTLSPTPTP